MIKIAFRLMKAWKVIAAAVILSATFCGQARAVNDVLAKWTFEGATPTGTTTTFGPIATDFGIGGAASGVHANPATWSSPVGNGSGKSFSVNTWSAGDYWQFSTDTTGVSNIGFEFDQISSATGPRDFKMQYSTDGSTFTDFGTYSVGPNATPNWSSAEQARLRESIRTTST